MAAQPISATLRPTLLYDQLERISHWATAADATATYALLQRLAVCAASPLELAEHAVTQACPTPSVGATPQIES